MISFVMVDGHPTLTTGAETASQLPMAKRLRFGVNMSLIQFAPLNRSEEVECEVRSLRSGDRPNGGSLQILNHKEKLVSASRRNPHAGRVRSPDSLHSTDGNDSRCLDGRRLGLVGDQLAQDGSRCDRRFLNRSACPLRWFGTGRPCF
jgi:hypothetical protein